ncbi:MAG TPA: hypothetical protein VGG34_02680 [Opitutaceae bacterium]|jgi:hypothetical protein
MTHAWRRAALAGALAAGLARPLAAQVDPVDAVDQALSFGSADGTLRARVSGTVDLEGYYLTLPESGLVFDESRAFLNPRLSLFLDAQLGPQVYVFAQVRADDGFDPDEPGPKVRPDEYALRYTPLGDGRLNFQVGKFATVVGNWTLRHLSWDNPFVTAPLPYENLTGIWDTDAAPNVFALMAWAGMSPRPVVAGAFLDQYRNVPVIWGPSYASGASVFGMYGDIQYAFEVKNASLSSRPEEWQPTDRQWQDPTYSGRIGYVPNEMWNFGVSASAGSYLRQDAVPTLAPGTSLDNYMEIVLAQDASFAWHHVQVWAEAFETRFEIPEVGDADTFAYYVEAKYQFAPQFFGALRWNQQYFSSLEVPGIGETPWSRDVSRVDLAAGYRPTPHTQVKLQYSLEKQAADIGAWSQLVAVQLTLRF